MLSVHLLVDTSLVPVLTGAPASTSAGDRPTVTDRHMHYTGPSHGHGQSAMDHHGQVWDQSPSLQDLEVIRDKTMCFIYSNYDLVSV